MIEFTHVVADPLGLHARPVMVIASAVRPFASSVTLSCGGHEADGKDLTQLMALGAHAGDVLTAHVEGADEEDAAEALRVALL